MPLPSNPNSLLAALLLSAGLVGIPSLVPGQLSIFDSGSTGADGALDVNSNMTMTIDQAEYNYTTINVAEGATLTLEADVSNNFPAIFLASGDVTIAGTIDLSGESGHPGDAVFPVRAVGGPGGWSGGVGAQAGTGNPDLSLQPTAGEGPGAGLEASDVNRGGSGAGYRNGGNAGNSDFSNRGGGTYGNSFGIPPLGGSGGGGGGWNTSFGAGTGGGAGGGALVVASSGSITVSGSILARGGAGGTTTNREGGGGASGGLIRLVANTIVVTDAAVIDAGGGLGGNQGGQVGGRGSDGRVRLDAFAFDLDANAVSVPIASSGVPILVGLPSDAPQLTITSIGGNTVTDPKGVSADPDVTISTSDPVTVDVQSVNIPEGTIVTLQVLALNGPSQRVNTNGLTGAGATRTASADVAFQPGLTQIVATASFTPTRRRSTPDGEVVAKIEVQATLDGKTEVAWITESGRRYYPGTAALH